jgi:redox-sensing transcriptional repressor
MNGFGYISIIIYRYELVDIHSCPPGAVMSADKTLVHVPVPTLRRLPTYHHYLLQLRSAGRPAVSCTHIAEDLKLYPTQVRKDLAATGIVGKPKVGYDIDELIESIETFLGWNDSHSAFLVGVGGLGSALIGYPGFERYGFDIVAGFDVDPDKVGTVLRGKRILNVDKLPDLARRMHVHIGIIAVPDTAAQIIADVMVRGGIRAIWNFAPTGLKVPEGVVVQNEDLASSLAVFLQKHALSTGETQPGGVQHHVARRA